MTGVCHTHQRHRELHLTDFQLQRAEPRGEHILEFTSPQSLYGSCWRAASALPGPEVEEEGSLQQDGFGRTQE